MCVLSYVGDQYRDDFPNRWPNFPLQPWTNPPYEEPSRREISREEFNALKAEVRELRKLLLAAKEFDEATGQVDCEMEEKIEFIRRLADYVGVDLDEVFGSRDG